MTDNMVERVARAIRKSDQDDLAPEFYKQYENDPDAKFARAAYQARAAIATMREPTEKMIDAVYDTELDIVWSYAGTEKPGGPDAVFKIMIDAALSNVEPNTES